MILAISGYATLIGMGAESGSWSKCAIGHTRTGGSVGAITDPFINFGKNNGGGLRNCKVGYNSGFTFCIGDFGNVNNNSNNWSQQFGYLIKHHKHH